MEEDNEKLPNVIELNVGGQHFTTLLSTLTKYEDSMLAAMFSGRHCHVYDQQGRYFIDSDGSHFGHILNFLRRDTIPPDDAVEHVYEEAVYFGITELVKALNQHGKIASHMHRENFVMGLCDFNEVLDKITEVVASDSTRGKSFFMYLATQPKDWKPILGDFDNDHRCTAYIKNSGARKLIQTHLTVKVDPWNSGQKNGQEVLDCYVFYLRKRGFNVEQMPDLMPGHVGISCAECLYFAKGLVDDPRNQGRRINLQRMYTDKCINKIFGFRFDWWP